ncbi:antibiotic biosynthesis monooxygenase family protein [Aquimarina celericrescens]|uniref:Antibiotic biosynthesis monooxygenase family protein n=1 Tax=Aquimarina celericrescens TaxID=1964542 RepID=A0ABW5AZ93_9FLAO|nr:antibiotic biosynthesis monooxygenase [Aquimarina celericrescens]
MVVEYIRYKIEKSRQNNFINAYTKASEQLHTSEFCLGYELSHCEEDPDNFILRIEWTSTDDHLNGFRKSSDFMKFLKHVKPFFNDIQEMNHYQVTAVALKKQL